MKKRLLAYWLCLMCAVLTPTQASSGIFPSKQTAAVLTAAVAAQTIIGFWWVGGTVAGAWVAHKAFSGMSSPTDEVEVPRASSSEAGFGSYMRMHLATQLVVRLLDVIIITPFVQPIMDKLTRNLWHPPLLQGDSSLTYWYRDVLGVCNNSQVVQMLKTLPIDVCVPKKKVLDLHQLVYPEGIKKQLTQFEALLLERMQDDERLPNLILTGPPGSGKTAMVEALAKKLNLNLQRVSGSDLVQSHRAIDDLATALRWADGSSMFSYNVIRDARIVLVFIDEVEVLARSRESFNPAGSDVHQRGHQALAQMLALINNSGSSRYFVVVATNLPRTIVLDKAFVQRFDVHMNVETPGAEEREQLLHLYLDGRLQKANIVFEKQVWTQWAQEAEGLSAREIAVAINNIPHQVKNQVVMITTSSVKESIRATKVKSQTLGSILP